MKKAVSLLAAVALSAASQAASAVTIDFDALTGSGLVDRGLSYAEDGFRLDAVGQTSNHLGSIQAGDYRYTGTPSFFNNTIGGTTQLSKMNGGSFILSSIDLDSLNHGAQVSVTFEASTVAGGTVTQTFVTDSSFPSLQTFNFSSFVGVTTVRWNQVSPFHSFDNIVIADEQRGNVPEPASLALLGVGALGVAATRRRKQ